MPTIHRVDEVKRFEPEPTEPVPTIVEEPQIITPPNEPESPPNEQEQEQEDFNTDMTPYIQYPVSQPPKSTPIAVPSRSKLFRDSVRV